MSSSKSRSLVKIAAVSMALAAGAAQASSAQLRSKEVSGDFLMQDGQTLRIAVWGQRVLVEGATQEAWTAAGRDLLVSPDGLRRISLLRNADGIVDRIELRTTVSTR